MDLIVVFHDSFLEVLKEERSFGLGRVAYLLLRNGNLGDTRTSIVTIK